MRNDFISEGFESILDQDLAFPDPIDELPDNLPDWMEDDSYKECRDVEAHERENCKKNVDNRTYFQGMGFLSMLSLFFLILCIVVFFYNKHKISNHVSAISPDPILNGFNQNLKGSKIFGIAGLVILCLTLGITFYFYTKLSNNYSKFKMTWGGKNRNKVLNFATKRF